MRRVAVPGLNASSTRRPATCSGTWRRWRTARSWAWDSTSYTQNPSGLSVSDTRSNLALVLGIDGTILKRLTLPAGPSGRGNEITSVPVIGGRQAMFAGVKNAPGTHAEVFSDAFLSLRPLE